MNISVVNIFNVLLHLSIMVIMTKPSELGGSACRYSGTNDEDKNKCRKDLVKLKYLPETCSSFIYYGATHKPNEGVVIVSDNGENTLKTLVEFGKTVFLFYGRDIDAWFDFFDSGDPVQEANEVIHFLYQYRVGGFILNGLDYSFTEISDYYQKFSDYVSHIKTEMSDFSIGIYFNALDIIKFKDNSTWFDFTKLNVFIDFYIIQFYDFNPCTKDFLRSGITPLESTNEKVRTLNQFKDALCNYNIPKNKTHFEFLINPKVDEIRSIKTFPYCEISYNEYCENEDDYSETWCVDNPDTLYQKGQFAKDYSNGFVARYIDLIDRDEKCDCNGDKYITYNMIYNGYTTKEKLQCYRLKIN